MVLSLFFLVFVYISFFKEHMFKIKGKQVLVEKSQKHPTGWPLRLCCQLVSSSRLPSVRWSCTTPALHSAPLTALLGFAGGASCSWRGCWARGHALYRQHYQPARPAVKAAFCLGDPRATPLVCVPHKTVTWFCRLG